MAIPDPPRDQRTATLMVRVFPAELEGAKADARTHQETLSGWVRRCLILGRAQLLGAALPGGSTAPPTATRTRKAPPHGKKTQSAARRRARRAPRTR